MDHQHLLSSWRIKSLILTTILAMCGYILFAIWGGWDQVVDAAYKVGILGTLAALGLTLVNMFLRYLRWRYFIAQQGYDIPFAAHMRIYISGYALTPTPAKTGEALRSVFLADYHVPYRVSFGVFLSERFSDLLSIGVIACVGLWLLPNFRWLSIAIGVFLILVLVLLKQIRWIKAIADFFRKRVHNRFFRSIEFLFDMALSFQNCLSPKTLIFGIAMGIIAWSAQGLSFYYVLQLMGADFSLFWANYIYCVALLVGSLTFLPGGVGATEVVMLQFLVYHNVELPVAVAATVFIRFTTLWFSVLVGILLLPLKKLLFVK
jgi:glycosyltransferase 2 family protein